MTPIDILIRSQLEAKGFQEAKKYLGEMGDAVKAGFGIAIGERILGTLQKIPEILTDAAKDGIKFNATIETQTVAFETLLGSVVAAHDRIAELTEFTEKNPIFNFGEVSEADRLLQNLTKGALSSAEGLKLVGDVSAASGRPLGEIAETVGRLYAGLQEGLPVQRATMQLLNMGIISGETARKLEETAQSGMGIGDAMSIVQRTFASTTGAMAKQTGTLSGQITAFKLNIESLEGILAKPISGGLKDWLEGVNELLSGKKGTTGAQIREWIEWGMKNSWIADISKLAQIAGVLSVPGNTDSTLLARTPSRGEFFAKAPEGSGERPLTDAQKQMQADLQKNFTETWRTGLSDREKLEDEYLQKISEAEDTFAGNEKALHENLAKIEEAYDRQRVLLRSQADDEAEKNAKEAMDREATYRRELQQRAMQEDMDALRIKRDEISLAEAKLEAAFGQTELEKRGQRIKLIKEEIDAIDQLIKKLTAQREAESDPAARQSINQQITSLAGEKRGAEAKLVPFTDGASPTSFSQQWTKAIVELRDQWGTAAQQMATSFKDVFNSAISSISSGITGLIMGTQTWGQALLQIGMSILQTIIQAIVQMGIRWVATQIMMAVAGKSIQASMVAANAPLALASAAIWATPATLATIASYGAAAAAAPAFITAAEGITMASSLAMFKEGGYTGDGDPSDAAGVAHKGEFYFTAPQTKAMGPSNLARLAKGGWTAMASSAMGKAFSGSGGGGGGGNISVNAAPVNVAVMNGREELRQFLESSDGQKIIFDSVSRRKLDLGIPT